MVPEPLVEVGRFFVTRRMMDRIIAVHATGLFVGKKTDVLRHIIRVGLEALKV